MLDSKLPEWVEIERLVERIPAFGRAHIPAQVESGSHRFPLYAVSFGTEAPEAPVLALFGGVHGLERIGSQVVNSLLRTFLEILTWDEVMHEALKGVRIVFMPLINPLGMLHRRRSNANGVDLMRNAPVDAEGEASFLVGGQRWSPRLPWYRGPEGAPMETETRAIVDIVRQEIFSSKIAISMDFHSGFGLQDQIWFPYAKTTKPFPHLAEMHAFKALLDQTHPYHFYKIEPQAKNYTTHGDVWDYVYEGFHGAPGGRDRLYLPLTLEMGSWMWIKKNPRQFFSALGPFNPMKPHRQKRILRRHQTLFDFMIRAVRNPQAWATLAPEKMELHEKAALDDWYMPGAPAPVRF